MNWSFRGWWRVGVVMTVLWIVTGPYYILARVDWPREEASGETLIQNVLTAHWQCMHAAPPLDVSRCDRLEKQGWAETGERARQADRENMRHLVFYAFAPLPIFWLLLYTLVLGGRWARSLFKDGHWTNVIARIAPDPGKSLSIWSIGRWWRLGVLLSLGWLVAVPIQFALVVRPASEAIIQRHADFIEREYGDCRLGKKWPGAAQSLCVRLRAENLSTLHQLTQEIAVQDRNDLVRRMSWNLLAYWILGYGLLVTGRWTWKGFGSKAAALRGPASV